MRIYTIVTNSARRTWYAENFQHAIEQHKNAYESNRNEGIITVIEGEYLDRTSRTPATSTIF